MQAVRFTRAMSPNHAGDVRILPPPMARRLEVEGVVELGSLPDHPASSDGGFTPYATKAGDPPHRGPGRPPKAG